MYAINTQNSTENNYIPLLSQTTFPPAQSTAETNSKPHTQ